MLLSAVQKVREAHNKFSSDDYLKQISQAEKNYFAEQGLYRAFQRSRSGAQYRLR